MKDEFLSGLLFRINDATKPVDAADRNLIIRALSNSTQGADKRCQYCDNTGDVHSIDGEWRGVCTECKRADDAKTQESIDWFKGSHKRTVCDAITDGVMVQLFYAAQGDITQFRIKGRKIIEDAASILNFDSPDGA